MRDFRKIHDLDRRALQIWGAPLADEAFIDAYAAEREFWEAKGLMKGGMDNFILYALAKRFAKPAVKPEVVAVPEDNCEPVKRGPGRPRRELQEA